jgi:hypothetical protein
MKTKFKILIGLLIAIICCVGYILHYSSTFVEKNFKKHTGVKEYIVKVSSYNDFDSYIETIIFNSDKRTLLQKFKFENNLSKLKGRVEPGFVSENPNFIYYVIEDGYGPYGYVLFALEKEGNTLIVYEAYGN